MTRPDVPKPLAYLYEIRPVPMLATLLASVLGFLYAGSFPVGWPLYLLAIGSALYCGHAVDSIVDYHWRDEEKYTYMGVFEDSGGLLSAGELGGATLFGSLVFWASLLALGGPSPVLYLLIFEWVLALSYSTLLDKNTLTLSLAYPLGTTLAFLGAFLLAAGGLTAPVLGVASFLLLYLLGGKIVSDEIDLERDRSIGKSTVMVVLGEERGRKVGYSVTVLGLAAAVWLAAAGIMPVATLLGVAGASLILWRSWREETYRGTLILVGGGYFYLFVALAALLW